MKLLDCSFFGVTFSLILLHRCEIKAESTADGKFDFERVVKLLTGKHSSDDRERHIHALSRMTSWHSQRCYQIADLDVVGQIASVIALN